MNRILSGLLTVLFTFSAGLVWSEGDATAGQGNVALCAGCHGPSGNSAIPLYPNLAGQGEKYLKKQMLDTQSGERKILEMTGMLASFNEQDLADIAAFYGTQKAAVTGSRAIVDEAYGLSAEEFLALGERIFRGGNVKTGVAACTGCHSPTGQGNAPASYPAIAGQHNDYLVKQLSDFQRNLRKNDGEGQIMRAVASPMSDLEIRAVSNYLAGLN